MGICNGVFGGFDWYRANKAYQEYGFPGHPAYRQGHRAIDFVIIARVHFVVRTEIRDFDVISFAHQAIPVIENHRYRWTGNESGRSAPQTVPTRAI